MDFYDKDLIALLAAFQKYEIKYIIVGEFTIKRCGVEIFKLSQSPTFQISIYQTQRSIGCARIKKDS